MHCLGAVASAETASPSGVGSRGGVMSVIRALGILVCEGRIQGPPRGYKEGPHCAAPLQAPPNDHMCEKENYLCGRYLVLVREIADRITIGSSLCVEVLMCSDCPCGLARATCKDPVSLISSTSISPWQHPSDILLEYWSIGVVPTKNPEMMNSQGLYQAVRSRLHFSQVAAWWSRSNGKRPNYVSTRIVPYNLDNLRKFRESPIEHTFPLAGIGDGNSIKVTVWALPRMEDVPTLSCSVHTIKDNDEECVARALTPTKNGPVPSASHSTETLVLPVLVDDRLQTPCDKPGKHHCRCEDEDGCPPSPSIRLNGERKRRRSLPCGPPESVTPFVAAPLSSVKETITADERDTSQSPNYLRYTESSNYPVRNYRVDEQQSLCDDHTFGSDNRSYLSNGSLERSFRTQVSLEEQEGNEEKRYKPSSENFENEDSSIRTNLDENSLITVIMPGASKDWNRTAENDSNTFEKIDNSQFVPSDLSASWPFEAFRNVVRPAVGCDTNVVVNPFAESSSYHETNRSPSSNGLHARQNFSPTSPPCTVHQNYSRNPRLASSSVGKSSTDKVSKDEVSKNCFAPGKDLSHLMSKLAFPKDKASPKNREDGGILDWFSKVPGRVLAVPTVTNVEKSPNVNEPQEPKSNEVKFKNCNLELSQREFNEVLAVLRARTPSGRRRTPVKTIRRRDRSEKLLEDSTSPIASSDKSGKNSIHATDACVCPIHRQVQRSADLCACKFCRKTNNQPPHKSINGNSVDSINGQCVYRCHTEPIGAKASREDWPLDASNGVAKNTLEKSKDRLQNVSNKADVLLGAILRTSRERKGLTDISNGTRPRTVATTERSEDLMDPRLTTTSTRIVPFEDDKSLPSVLNKRLNRFKQLFKKEWDRREVSTTDVPPQEGFSKSSRKERDEGESNEQPRESRIKRKIDFTNFHVGMGKTEQSYERLVNGTISETHQNTQFNSTNSKRKGTNHRKAYERECSTVLSCDCHRVSEDETSFGNRSATPTASQNGLASARSCNNNDPISIDIDEDETTEKGVPSAIEQEQFRRSLENAASMVFHSRTGLPLTSSPAPLRRGSCCFDYDSSLNSVSSKRSALFELNTPPSPGAVSLEETDREIENSGEGEETPKRTSTSRSRPQSHALLGSFEESALNGRLEPVSTVHGFTAELGASGSFCPKHRKLPVTVFFYTLGDNDKVSTPYLAHINLGKKGYQVPRSGTIQVTLLNPLGTVVKMFVVLYDLSDMPPRSHTFLRQRTLRDKTLRYLVHLRFMSGKSGRIYLHTDIRMIICRKSDVDTASDFGSEPPKELRSYIHGPTNPKFSPRC